MTENQPSGDVPNLPDTQWIGEKPTVQQVAWVFGKLCDHLQQGGTFRQLIYGRMDFGANAYFPLYVAGGMAISNAFSRLRDLEGTDDTCGG